jgi:hypothetical protein
VVGLVLHTLHDIVIATKKVTVAGTRGNARGLDLTEQIQRIVPGTMPEGHVDGLEESASLATPAPPEVHGYGSEPLDARGEIGNASLLG